MWPNYNTHLREAVEPQFCKFGQLLLKVDARREFEKNGVRQKFAYKAGKHTWSQKQVLGLTRFVRVP